jgi:thiol-disulfide isomerase/thioredoxin
MTGLNRFLLIALAVTATALAALAAQNRAGDFILRRFDELDRNRDDRVTRDESGNASWFNALDANRDGELTRAEAGGGAAKLGSAATANPRSLNGLSGEKLFDAMDRNADGKLDASELPRRGMLQQLDRDGDGLVTREEAVESMRNLGREQTLVAKKPPTTTPPEPESPREGPQILNASERGVGRLVPDAAFTDIAGKSSTLAQYAAGKPLVIALTGTSCPLNKKFGPTLARLEDEYATKGVRFLFVVTTETDSLDNLRTAVKELGLDGAYVRDDAKMLVAALDAQTTTEVFVLDAARTLVFRGAVNDQYGLAYTLDAPRREFLRAALDAVLAGRRPEIAATTAPGCTLDYPKPQYPVTAAGITYHNRISRVLADNCVECHRTGGVGPFPLDTFADVKSHAAMIRRQVERGLMPPWFAAAKADAPHSPWLNDRSLNAEDREALLAWLDGPRAEGDPKDAPLPRVFPEGWQIGEPDLVVQIPRPVPIKADGFMPYHNVTVETTLTEDKWVSAFEVQPGVREAVHHVLVFVRPPATADDGEFDDEGAERHGFFAAYVPGNGHRVYPAGFANKLPAGSRLHFQIHYTPFGRATTDQTRLGLKFADTPPRHEVQVTGIANVRISIPPGAADHVETATLRVPVDVYVTAFMPHMHVRGKAFKYEVEFPDGRRETLLDVPRYDFNWQLAYTLKEPLRIPAGSIVRTTAVFDNSAGNPANPDPARAVRWGPQTVDEMMLGYLEFHTANDVTLGRGRGTRGRSGAE